MSAIGQRYVAPLVDPNAVTQHRTFMGIPGFPRLAVDPSVCGGRPTIAGTRLRVSDVLDMLAAGAAETDILADYPYLAPDDVRVVLAYAAASIDHPLVIAAE